MAPALLLALVLLLACEQPLCAYADPGSGALIWQGLLAVFVGAMFYLRRLTGWWKRLRRRAGSQE